MIERGTPPTRRTEAGLSLLEVLVALAVMAVSLGVLYQAVTAVVRNAQETERHAHAVVLATSLLALHDTIPQGGVDEHGATETGGEPLRWRLVAALLDADDARATDWPLYRTEVWVRWRSGAREREVHLFTLKLEQPVPIEEQE